jgi:5-methylcytosine-specific restriction protein A
MPRREFSVVIKRQMVKRSGGVCERHLWKPGEVCTKPAKEFDHIQPDGLGGEPTLSNGAHLCQPCHKEKSHQHDRPVMQRADNQRDAALGIKRKSRPIPQPPKAPKREPKPRLPPLQLYRAAE